MTRVTGESSSKRQTFSKALRGPDASASASRGCSAWLLVAAAGRGGSSREERSGDERPGAAKARRVGFGDRRSCAVPSGCASEAGDAGACAAGMAVGRRHCFVLLPFASSGDSSRRRPVRCRDRLPRRPPFLRSRVRATRCRAPIRESCIQRSGVSRTKSPETRLSPDSGSSKRREHWA